MSADTHVNDADRTLLSGVPQVNIESPSESETSTRHEHHHHHHTNLPPLSHVSSDPPIPPSAHPPLHPAMSSPNLFAKGSYGSDSNSDEVEPFTTEEADKEHTHLFQPSSTAHKDYDLLDWFDSKHSDEYRFVKFGIPEDRDPKTLTKAKYQKRVSFDTVNLQYNDDNDSDDVDQDYGWNSFQSRIEDYNSDRGRGRQRKISPTSSPGNTSPLASPSRQIHHSVSPGRRGASPMRNASMDLSGIDLSMFVKPKLSYPTKPIITHRGCTLTKLHEQFEDLYLGKLPIKPILPSRVILVYVSARKHTWVALDWILSQFIEDGDTVIVVSAIDSKQLIKPKRRFSNFSPQRMTTPVTPKMRLRQRNRPDYIKVIAKNIMTYIMEVMNPNKITKVSVELAAGRTKKVLKEMYKLYEPNLVCTGSKANLRIGAPLVSWTSSKLTDRLVKLFPLPVIVVPAVNMNKFEWELMDQINEREQAKVDVEAAVAEDKNLSRKIEESSSDNRTNTTTGDEDDLSSIDSSSSASSLDSEASYSSYDEIAKLYIDYKQELTSDLKASARQPMNENFYAKYASLISDKSSALCRNIGEINPDWKGKGAKLAKAITGSTSFSAVPYKTKSLLAPVEKASTSSTGVSYKEMKKNLMRNRLEKEKSRTDSLSPPPPQITVHPPSGPTSSDSLPDGRKSTLKFVGLESPSAAAKPQEENPEEKSKKSKKPKKKSLMKSLSHDLESKTSRPKLEPLSSHPDITSNPRSRRSSEDASKDEKRKSKRKFWKLFK